MPYYHFLRGSEVFAQRQKGQTFGHIAGIARHFHFGKPGPIWSSLHGTQSSKLKLHWTELQEEFGPGVNPGGHRVPRPVPRVGHASHAAGLFALAQSAAEIAQWSKPCTSHKLAMLE